MKLVTLRGPRMLEVRFRDRLVIVVPLVLIGAWTAVCLWCLYALIGLSSSVAPATDARALDAPAKADAVLVQVARESDQRR